jgi:hypothetical protein
MDIRLSLAFRSAFGRPCSIGVFKRTDGAGAATGGDGGLGIDGMS